ncbi:MAG: siroheme decarboxylase subunit alpha [Armatimonadota bacterium]
MADTLSPLDQRVLNYIQTDFPLAADPYGEIAREVGCTQLEAYETVKELRKRGIIRRIGGSFVASKLGYVSALVAARVEPAKLEEAAAVASSFPEVTHNYEREAEYNLWFTVIAEDRQRMEEILDAVSRCAGVETVQALPAGRTFKIRVEFAFQEGERDA